MHQRELYFGRLFGALTAYSMVLLPLLVACGIATNELVPFGVLFLGGAILLGALGLLMLPRRNDQDLVPAILSIAFGVVGYLIAVAIIGKGFQVTGVKEAVVISATLGCAAFGGLILWSWWSLGQCGHFGRSAALAMPSFQSSKAGQIDLELRKQSRWPLWLRLELLTRGSWSLWLMGLIFPFMGITFASKGISSVLARNDLLPAAYHLAVGFLFLTMLPWWITKRTLPIFFVNKTQRAIMEFVRSAPQLIIAVALIPLMSLGAMQLPVAPITMQAETLPKLGCEPNSTPGASDDSLESAFAHCLANRSGLALSLRLVSSEGVPTYHLQIRGRDTDLTFVGNFNQVWASIGSQMKESASRQSCIALVLLFALSLAVSGLAMRWRGHSMQTTHASVFAFLMPIITMAGAVLVCDQPYPLHRIWTADLFAFVNSYYYPLLAAGAALIVVLYIRNLRWFVKHGGAS
ncbi:MAG: hypothetical protein MUC50_14265 [Myxococcota bacterium]|nr:hypothetical protein [Myxococcota bacterium]